MLRSRLYSYGTAGLMHDVDQIVASSCLKYNIQCSLPLPSNKISSACS